MRLHAITLENVRRFEGRATVGPIHGGLSLLCEPNETGKSTLFDALHALFFVKHTGGGKEIKALQPHSGGAVAVEVEILLDGARWRLRKRWIQGKEAKVWRDGTLVHQGGEADDWIAALVGEAGTGPSGLLWVRQGLTGLSGETTREAAQSATARRDLLTSVLGGVDDLTGGRRMEAALAQVQAEKDALATQRGPKKNGRWDVARTRVETLAAERDALVHQVADLRDALDGRVRTRRDLAAADDPEERGRREADLGEARVALAAAERHAQRLEAAATELTLADMKLTGLREAAARRAASAAELKEAKALAETAAGARDAETTVEAAARETRTKAASELEAAEEARTSATRTLDRVLAAERAAEAAETREELMQRIAQADVARRRSEDARGRAKGGPDMRAMALIEDLVRTVDDLRRARDAGAPRLTFRYAAGAGPATAGGAAFDDGVARPLPGGGKIDLPGFGSVTLDLANAAYGTDEIKGAEAALSDALRDGGWDGPDAARAAARARSEAEAEARTADAEFAVLAPDGIEALRERLARLPTPPEAVEDLPDRATAEATAQEAEDAVAEARAAASRAAHAHDARLQALTRAEAEAVAAAARLTRAEAAVTAEAVDPGEAATALDAATAARAEAYAAHAALAETAPETDALRVRVTRLERAIASAAEEVSRCRERLGRLEERIGTRAEAGVEERLAETETALDAAREDEARIAFEVDVLTRLEAVLIEARKQSRETYFKPIARELRPLLSLLWPDATLVWSEETMLPTALIRDGREEPIDVLSGGTQEQVAFLVRLAFSRLLAKDGRHAPIILDDALVYSDDDRIERMFEALQALAEDTQILVLSCRQRAFRELGARRVTFDEAAGA